VSDTSTETLVNAMRLLAAEIQSEDGVANAAIYEAADRLEEQHSKIERLVNAGDELAGLHLFASWTYDSAKKHVAAWTAAKEGKA
jgi:hypothetical protein